MASRDYLPVIAALTEEAQQALLQRDGSQADALLRLTRTLLDVVAHGVGDDAWLREVEAAAAEHPGLGAVLSEIADLAHEEGGFGHHGGSTCGGAR